MNQLTLEARAPAHHEPTRVADGGDAAGHIYMYMRRRRGAAAPAAGAGPPGVRAQ